MDNQSRGSTSATFSPKTALANRLTWALVALISASYFFGLTPGHIFAQDDFAAYVMHAANLVEGHPYTQIRYVPNPDAPWVGPANGYPPAYPLLLAPVYWKSGLDFHAMKIVTVLTFAVFLLAYAVWIHPQLSPNLRVIAVLLVGLNPVFWKYRDFISSEFPYLMFSFLALLAMRKANTKASKTTWNPRWALLVAFLMYATYATRTIGIALPVALACREIADKKRFSRLAILTFALLAALIALQATLLTSPSGYLSASHISAASVLNNLWSYAKSITFAWENGYSKAAQACMGLALTACAGFAFVRRNWSSISIEAWYMLAYLAILLAWGTQIGIRGLLPIVPIYLTYTLLGISDLASRIRPTTSRAFIAAIAVCIAATYIASLRQPIRPTTGSDVNDSSARELFAFLQTHTAPSDLMVYSKPRTISLFTGRMATSLGPDAPPEESAKFLQHAGARVLIQSRWNPPAYDRLIAKGGCKMSEIFRNRDFQVLRLGDYATTSDLASR